MIAIYNYSSYNSIMAKIKDKMRTTKKGWRKEMGPTDVKFLFWLNKDLRTEIKVRAAARNISMAHWIIQAIVERIKKEERFAAKE